jgi:hypothetical protein
MISGLYVVFLMTKTQTFFHVLNFILSRHFLPFGRADLTASASLQPIRSRSLQLYGLPPRRYSNLGP